MPLNHFDSVAIGVGDKETIGPGNFNRLTNVKSLCGQLLSRRTGVINMQRKMTRAGGIGIV